MPKRALAQELVRKRIIAARGASVGEVYAPGAAIEANPVPADVESNLVKQVNDLLDRIRKTAIPAELRAEMRAYTGFYTDIVNLHNSIVDYLAANMYSPTERLLKALLTLQKHAVEYRDRIAKRAGYLKEPMPELPDIKPIPGLIVRAPRTGWRMIRL
jgi:hypothetical protein